MGAADVRAQGGGDIATVTAAEQGDSEIAAGGEDLGRGAGADVAAILVKGDVADVMDLLLDAPMAPREGEQVRGVRAVAGEAGDGVGDLRLHLAGGLADAPPLDQAELLNVRPWLPEATDVAHADVLGRISERPEDAPFQAPVLGLGRGIHGDGKRGAALLPRALR
ncbi:MAG: hypothetical protein M1296_05835 [Chloroflexi bacterium]|nr:hypothetical protein [Chloroflexota bacterium]